MSYPKSPFTTVEDHYARLDKEVKRKPTSVFVASFGLNIGLYKKESGEFYSKNSLTRQFLDSLKGVKKVDILIGFPAQRRGESHQDFSYRKAMLKRAMKRWPKYNWRISEHSHIKCVGFEKKGSVYCIVAGGRNLTDSSFSDLSLVVPKVQRASIKKLFYKFFRKATPA